MKLPMLHKPAALAPYPKGPLFSFAESLGALPGFKRTNISGCPRDQTVRLLKSWTATEPPPLKGTVTYVSHPDGNLHRVSLPVPAIYSASNSKERLYLVEYFQPQS